jgi:hypothetical protein
VHTHGTKAHIHTISKCLWAQTHGPLQPGAIDTFLTKNMSAPVRTTAPIMGVTSFINTVTNDKAKPLPSMILSPVSTLVYYRWALNQASVASPGSCRCSTNKALSCLRLCAM